MPRNDERNQGVPRQPERAEPSRNERERTREEKSEPGRSDNERAIRTSQETHQGSLTPRGSEYGVSTWDPFTLMRRFSEEIDRVFSGRGGLGLSRWGEARFSPQVEVFERGGKLVVRADLPGLRKEDVQVELQDNLLTIKGERKETREDKRDNYYVSERSFGSFQRTIPLPRGVNGENARASFNDGVLEIELDAPQVQSGRRIEISEGSASGERGRTSR